MKSLTRRPADTYNEISLKFPKDEGSVYLKARHMCQLSMCLNTQIFNIRIVDTYVIWRMHYACIACPYLSLICFFKYNNIKIDKKRELSNLGEGEVEG